MTKIKSTSEIAAKYARVTPGRATDYEMGIKATSAEDYAAAAKASEPAYIRGVQEAIAQKRYGKGIDKGKDKWKRKAEELGPSRFATGVAAATDDYADGFAPYQEIIAQTTLPPRGPAGDPKNIERVRVLAEALRKKKVSG